MRLFRKEQQFRVGQVVDDRSYNKNNPTLGIVTEVVEDKILKWVRRSYRVQTYNYSTGAIYPDQTNHILKARQITPHGRLQLSPDTVQEGLKIGKPEYESLVRRDILAWINRSPEENIMRMKQWGHDYDPA